MKLSKELKASYDQYLKAYARTEKSLNNRGIRMGMKKLSQRDFKIEFERGKLDKGLFGKVTAKQSYDIVRRIVSDQKYDYSEAQFKALLKGAKQAQKNNQLFPGQKINKEWLQKNYYDVKDAIKNIYSDLKSQGLSGTEAQGWISTNIYGSP